MKTVKILSAVFLVGVLFALVGGVVLGLAQGPEPSQGDVSLAAEVASRFSYQGVLRENGSPVTGRRDLTFRLHSDDACTTQMGGDIARPGVEVTDGLFSVELDVTHSHFNGQGLWLGVALGSTKIGCQEILAVPYALSLKPGAIISDTTTSVDLNRLQVIMPGGITIREGLYAETTGFHDLGFGLSGYAANSSSNYGVYGSSVGNGAGVYGDSDSGIGVSGSSDSGSGVYGSSNSGDGVYGSSASSNGVSGGSAGGNGVYGGSNTGNGVYGDSASGNGVYGSSPFGTAIFADGDVKQSLTGSGLIKAAVVAFCEGPTGASIDRSFNNVTSENFAITSGPSKGRCSIDFKFDISDRFWVAMAEHDSAGRGVSCQLNGGDNSKLDCFRWRADTGAAYGGPIMVLVY